MLSKFNVDKENVTTIFMKTHLLLLFLTPLVLYSHVYGQSACDFFSVQVEALSPVARYDTLSGSFMFCAETAGEEQFRAMVAYDSDTIDLDASSLIYTWVHAGETYATRQVSFILDGPGAYPFSLKVEDPLLGCSLTLYKVALVATVPTFNGTMPSLDVVCAKDAITLRGEANPVTWTGFPTAVEGTVPLDGDQAGPYETSLEFDVFGEEQLVDTVMDLDRICVHIDHVDFGQVRFELECPDGATIVLKDFGMGGANLGEPVIWDNFTPGRGYHYCFTPAPLFGTMEQTSPEFHAYSDQAGNYYFNAAFMPPGSYTPDESLQRLIGCPMNGRWTLRVFDNSMGGNGYMHGWSLFFDESYYPDSLIFTPEIVREQWYNERGPVSGNPAQVTENEEGEYTYRFEVEDNFGCVYDTIVAVKVLPLPEAEIISDLEMPVCEGDSTYLRVRPVAGSDFDWVYQWMIGASDMPDRVFDTIMVKEPATYTVMIIDTLTRCQDEFSFNFDDQNCELVIPNVFTPNADGLNDLFEIENLEHYPMAQIVIFNRWGKRVFEHPDYYNNWWDGQGHPDGVYFYVLKYERMGKVRYAEGSVTIIR